MLTSTEHTKNNTRLVFILLNGKSKQTTGTNVNMNANGKKHVHTIFEALSRPSAPDDIDTFSFLHGSWYLPSAFARFNSKGIRLSSISRAAKLYFIIIFLCRNPPNRPFLLTTMQTLDKNCQMKKKKNNHKFQMNSK